MKRALAIPLALLFALIFSAPSVNAQERTFNDWLVNRGDDGTFFFAVTGSLASQDAEEKLFGQWCYVSGSCAWMLAMKLRCDKDEEYPVLVNADAGAETLSVKCFGPLEGSALYKYGFMDFDKVSASINRGRLIGFAFPLKSGYFQVLRFSLAGAPSALADMRQRATRSTPPISPARRGMRDERL